MDKLIFLEQDLEIFTNLRDNFEYASRLINTIQKLKTEKFEHDFTYAEITYFSRIKDDNYHQMLSSAVNEIKPNFINEGKVK